MGPGRPPNINDLVMNTNGSPNYLGAIVSAGAATNNATTALPFNQVSLGAGTMNGTLAGKTLLLQTTAAGLIIASTSANMVINGVPGQNIIALQSVLPPALGTVPGVSLISGERVILVMLPTQGWLQWLPLSGSANLLVYELL